MVEKAFMSIVKGENYFWIYLLIDEYTFFGFFLIDVWELTFDCYDHENALLIFFNYWWLVAQIYKIDLLKWCFEILFLGLFY